MTELADLIRKFREDLEAELPLRLHTFSGGSPAEGRHTVQGRPELTYGHMTGLPFSRPFDRYLSGQHGGDFPASDCFAAIRDWCRAEHWREQHTNGNPFAWNLCARVVIAAVELRQPVTFIAATENTDLWDVRNLLRDALRFADRWRTDRKAGVRISDESKLQLDEADALPVVLRREHAVDQEQQMWEMWRERFPYIRPWESELLRRRAYHAIHCGGSCPLLRATAA